MKKTLIVVTLLSSVPGNANIAQDIARSYITKDNAKKAAKAVVLLAGGFGAAWYVNTKNEELARTKEKLKHADAELDCKSKQVTELAAKLALYEATMVKECPSAPAEKQEPQTWGAWFSTWFASSADGSSRSVMRSESSANSSSNSSSSEEWLLSSSSSDDSNDYSSRRNRFEDEKKDTPKVVVENGSRAPAQDNPTQATTPVALQSKAVDILPTPSMPTLTGNREVDVERRIKECEDRRNKEDAAACRALPKPAQCPDNESSKSDASGLRSRLANGIRLSKEICDERDAARKAATSEQLSDANNTQRAAGDTASEYRRGFVSDKVTYFEDKGGNQSRGPSRSKGNEGYVAQYQVPIDSKGENIQRECNTPRQQDVAMTLQDIEQSRAERAAIPERLAQEKREDEEYRIRMKAEHNIDLPVVTAPAT